MPFPPNEPTDPGMISLFRNVLVLLNSVFAGIYVQIFGISVTTSQSERTAKCTRVVAGTNRALTLEQSTTPNRSEQHSSETLTAQNRTISRLMPPSNSFTAESTGSATERFCFFYYAAYCFQVRQHYYHTTDWRYTSNSVNSKHTLLLEFCSVLLYAWLFSVLLQNRFLVIVLPNLNRSG